jgi:hypothetical protein
MGLFKRLKKYSAAMCSASNKRGSLGVYLLALVIAMAPPAAADTGIVSAVGSGREVSEATLALLQSVVGKYFREEPANLSKGILQNEILPNSSSFVQSYKILEGGRGSSVSLSASVDLDVIRALMRFTPVQLNQAEGAKALVVVKGARLPEAAASTPEKARVKIPDPYSILAAGARERFARRGFEVVVLSEEEFEALGAGDDVASPELLRGLGARSGARVAMGISSRYESFENENSHNKEQRILVSATIVDIKAASVLGKASVTVSEPKSRKEVYATDLQRSLGEEGKDLFHEAFVQAGRKILKVPGQEDLTLVRIQYPSNAILVSRFRALLEANKSVRSVVEHSVSRGFFDLAVRPAMKPAAAVKMVKSLVSQEILVMVVDSPTDPGAAAVVVKLAPKEVAAEPNREVQSEESF